MGFYVLVAFIVTIFSALLYLGYWLKEIFWDDIISVSYRWGQLAYNQRNTIIILIGLFFIGQGAILEQENIMIGVDYVWECGGYKAYQITFSLLFPIRLGWETFILPYNDIVLYLRECFAILVNELEMTITFSTSIVNQIVGIVQSLFNLVIHILRTPVDVPSTFIVFFTEGYNIIYKPIEDTLIIIFQIVLDLIRLTPYSEDCDFCRFATSITPRTCIINTFAAPGVTINCNACHDYNQGAFLAIASFATTFLNATGLENVSVIVNNLAVDTACIVSLIKRPLWVVIGLIDGLINPGTCLSFGDILPQLLLWGQDMLDCFNSLIETISNGAVSDFFQFIAGIILNFITIIIDGVRGFSTCINSTEQKNCQGRYPNRVPPGPPSIVPGVCRYPSGGTLPDNGLFICNLILNECLSAFEFFEPSLQGDPSFFNVAGNITRIIDSVVCPVALLISCFNQPFVRASADSCNGVSGCINYFVAGFTCAGQAVPPLSGLFNGLAIAIRDVRDAILAAISFLRNQFDLIVTRIVGAFRCFGDLCVQQGFSSDGFTVNFASDDLCDVTEAIECMVFCFSDPSSCRSTQRSNLMKRNDRLEILRDDIMYDIHKIIDNKTMDINEKPHKAWCTLIGHFKIPENTVCGRIFRKYNINSIKNATNDYDITIFWGCLYLQSIGAVLFERGVINNIGLATDLTKLDNTFYHLKDISNSMQQEHMENSRPPFEETNFPNFTQITLMNDEPYYFYNNQSNIIDNNIIMENFQQNMNIYNDSLVYFKNNYYMKKVDLNYYHERTQTFMNKVMFLSKNFKGKGEIMRNKEKLTELTSNYVNYARDIIYYYRLNHYRNRFQRVAPRYRERLGIKITNLEEELYGTELNPIELPEITFKTLTEQSKKSNELISLGKEFYEKISYHFNMTKFQYITGALIRTGGRIIGLNEKNRITHLLDMFKNFYYSEERDKSLKNLTQWINGKKSYLMNKGFTTNEEYERFFNESELEYIHEMNSNFVVFQRRPLNYSFLMIEINYKDLFQSIPNISPMLEEMRIKREIRRKEINESIILGEKNYKYVQDSNAFDYNDFFLQFIQDILGLFIQAIQDFVNSLTNLLDSISMINLNSFFLNQGSTFVQNLLTCQFPAMINNSLIYNAICLPVVPERIFDFFVIQNLALPQVPFPPEIIDNSTGTCINIYNGVFNPFWEFQFSDNCNLPGIRPFCGSCDYCQRDFFQCRNLGFNDGLSGIFYFLGALPAAYNGFFASPISLTPFSNTIVGLITMLLFILEVPMYFFLTPFLGIPVAFLINSIASALLFIPFYLLSLFISGFTISQLIFGLFIIVFLIAPSIITSLPILSVIVFFIGIFNILYLSGVFPFWSFSINQIIIDVFNIIVKIPILNLLPNLNAIIARANRFNYPLMGPIPFVDNFCWFWTFGNTALGVISIPVWLYVINLGATVLLSTLNLIFSILLALFTLINSTNIRILSNRLNNLEEKNKKIINYIQ